MSSKGPLSAVLSWGARFFNSTKVPVDDWGWLYFGPILVSHGLFVIASMRAKTIRFKQLMLSIWGLYWTLIVYYVQYFPQGSRVAFCDVTLTQCSYCLHEPISYLPGYFQLVDSSSTANRSIADSSLLYYIFHMLYPLIIKIPLIGRYMTYIGFSVSVIISLFCLTLTYLLIVEVQDICLVYVQLVIINLGLATAMYAHSSQMWRRGGALKQL